MTNKALMAWKRYENLDLIRRGVLEIGDGYRAKNSEMGNDGLPFARAGNINRGFNLCDAGILSAKSVAKAKNKISQPHDSVITTKGTFGRVAFVLGDTPAFVYSPQLCYWRVLDRSVFEPRFLYYWLQGPEFYAQAFQIKSSTDMADYASLADQRAMSITFPGVRTQREIAAILSSYDELIENNKRRIALLEKLAEEIYREWFVRLRFPGYENVKKFKGIPAGWEDKKFGQFCLLQRGFDLSDARVEAGPYPVIASTSVKAYHNQYKVEPPVITTGRSGSLGRVLFVNCRAWPHNTTLYVKHFFGNSPFLVYYTLKNMHLENYNAGTGVPTLNRNHLNGIPIIVPSKEIQNKFDNVVSKLHSQAELLVKTNENLVTTRDMLLPRLISGKLSVEDLDIQFPPRMMEEVAQNSDPTHHA